MTENKIVLNQVVPDFQFNSTAGLGRNLHDFKNKKLIIYFYPKDHTSGCTCEAGNFRD
jgi:peroxiredoxin Q/BCP